jgi:hypothetical protein
MTTLSSASNQSYGADPANIKWKIVRGDTAKLRVEFWQNDETTEQDTSDWTFASTAYDFKGDALDELDVTAGVGYVEITASPEITSTWGIGYKDVVAELAFDLQVTLGDDSIWTPIIGTIVVISDVTANPVAP